MNYLCNTSTRLNIICSDHFIIVILKIDLHVQIQRIRKQMKIIVARKIPQINEPDWLLSNVYNHIEGAYMDDSRNIKVVYYKMHP